MKKWFALILICLMLPGMALAVPEGFNASDYPIMDEEITVTCLFPRGTNQPTDFSDMWFVKKCREMLNINVEYELVETSAFAERKALTLASGDYPDIFFGGITAEDEQMYGRQGIFIDLADMIAQYAPNFTALMEQYPDIRAAIINENGQIFAMPVIYTAARDRVAESGYVNLEWLERTGMEMPATLDELYDLMCAFRDQDANGNGDPNDELPACYSKDNQTFKRTVLAALGVVGMEDDVLDGQYVFVPASEQYKQYLKYMNKLYAENLLDHDVFILAQEEYNAKLKNDLIGITDSTNPSVYIEDYSSRFSAIPMLTSDTFSEKIWPGQTFVYRNTGNFVVTDKCEYPEAVVRMVDFFFTTEGSLMVRSGPEAGTWEGEGGWSIAKDEAGNELHSVITYDTDKYNSYYNFRENQSPMSLPYNSSDYMGFVMIAGDERSAWYWQDRTSAHPLDSLKISYPQVTFTAEEQDVLNVSLIDMRNYVQSMEVKFITGEINIDSDWDTYISTLNNMGMQEVVKTKQEAYNRYSELLK